MKSVNKETLTERIESLQLAQECVGLSMNEEYMLIAYRMLLATMDSEPVVWTSEEAIAKVYCDETGMIGPKHLVGDVPLHRYPQPAPVVLKDHQIRELVNHLRDIAIEYHGTQQLRERIARVIRAAMLNQK